MDKDQKLKVRQYATYPVEQIASMTGADVYEVTCYLKELGYSDSQIKHEVKQPPEEPKTGRGIPLTEDVKQKIIELRKSGMKNEQVAERFGISVSSVVRTMAKHKKTASETADSVEAVSVQTKTVEPVEEDDTLVRLNIIASDFDSLKKTVEEDKSVNHILHCIFRLGGFDDECFGLSANSTEPEVNDVWHDINVYKDYLFSLIKKEEPAPSANGTSSTETVSNDTKPYIDYKAKFQKCQGAVEKIEESIMDIYQYMSEEEQRAFDYGEVHQQVKDVLGIFEEE